MSEILVLTPEQIQNIVEQAVARGVAQAVQANQPQDRLVNQTEAANLLGVAPNYFSQQQLWQYIPYSTLPGGDKRYRVSDILKYKGPSRTDITDHNPVPPAPATAQPSQRRGRRSMLSNLQNAAE